MEYNNDNRTPLDRLTDEFLSELLDCECDNGPVVTSNREKSNRNASVRNYAQREYYRPVNSTAVTDNDCLRNSSNKNHECNCSDVEPFVAPHLHGVPLSMVYSPHQQWENIYEAELGFERGTIFKSLDFPFMGAGCDCKCRSHPKR